MAQGKVVFSHVKAKRVLRDLRQKQDGEPLETFREKVSYAAEEMAIGSSTLWRYLAEGFSSNRQAIKFCKALDRHPSELLLPDERIAYETLLSDIDEMNEVSAGLIERNLATVRLARELLNWQRFFNTGTFGDDELTEGEIAHSNETERELAEMMLGRS